MHSNVKFCHFLLIISIFEGKSITSKKVKINRKKNTYDFTKIQNNSNIYFFETLRLGVTGFAILAPVAVVALLEEEDEVL